jgi:predicted 3-demethylubiquinone-9 3-methyltransferase (glyoxalase superfamily)
MTTQVDTFLMFYGNAEEAINFYVSLFPDSKVVQLGRYGANEPGVEGSVKRASFTLCGKTFLAIDSPVKHNFTFTPAISLYVKCQSEKEVENLFAKLSHKGNILMLLASYPFSKKYAWVTDRFGVSWQLSFN